MLKKILPILILLFTLALFAQEQLATTTEYILSAGDRISIEVMDHPEFSKELQILPDGSIEYPILGNLVIAGLSSRQLSEIIKHNLEPYIPNPVISIYVTSIYDEKINIFGYVNKPGSYQIFKPVNLVESFSIAGGIRNVRKVKHVKLIRKDGTIIDIKVSEIWFSNNKISTENELKLYPGDTLIVPPPFEFNWSMFSALISLLSLSLSVFQVFN
jgi:polysaccharide export outer membrane protein